MLRLPAFFGDHMVLQAGRGLPVWGWSAAGAQVHVRLGVQDRTAVADDAGRWRVVLDPLPHGGPLEMNVESGDEMLLLRDVLIGEVWLCSGQSNMAMNVSAAADAEREMARADHPAIRSFDVQLDLASQPQTDVKGAWRVCSPATAGSFSAVAYYFARELQRELGVPVGLLHAASGHTPAEAWMSRESLAAEPQLRPMLAAWERLLDEHPEARHDLRPFHEQWRAQLKGHDKLVRQWLAAAHEARLGGRPIPPQPDRPGGVGNNQNPTVLYNAMLAPLAGYALRGALWYQGETNAIYGQGYLYRFLLPALIRQWRRDWGQGDFPFLYVQLANHMDNQAPRPQDMWAELRESQLLTLDLAPQTAMVSAIDVGAADKIHPLNKQEVGRRLALAARARAYGQQVEFSGPLYQAMTVQDSAIRVSFRHAEGLHSRDGQALREFTIAGEDRRFVPAEARLEGQDAVVSSANLPHPVAVRYAWTDCPAVNLVNRADLPASPFRTDRWRLVTEPVTPPATRADSAARASAR